MAYMFAMHVEEELEHWPEESTRQRHWVSPGSCASPWRPCGSPPSHSPGVSSGLGLARVMQSGLLSNLLTLLSHVYLLWMQFHLGDEVSCRLFLAMYSLAYHGVQVIMLFAIMLARGFKCRVRFLHLFVFDCSVSDL